jgi:hypothetical protein
MDTFRGKKAPFLAVNDRPTDTRSVVA